MSEASKTGCPCCDDVESLPSTGDGIVEKVRERYARIAESGAEYCCGAGADAEVARRIGYDDGQLDAVPEEANLGLGCGAPIRHLGLQPGETVVDLGSGGGLDAFLAATQVGPAGRVIGVDMTPEMLERARRNAAAAGHANVEFREGRLEALPLDAAVADAVTSNCVINLVPDKAAVFREIARVLKPGGRLVVSDIVLDGELPEVLKQDLLAYVGCVAGAMQRDEYFRTIEHAGLKAVEILDDRDYLGAVGEELLPEEVRSLLHRLGVGVEQVRGRVRSVTFRAIR